MENPTKIEQLENQVHNLEMQNLKTRITDLEKLNKRLKLETLVLAICIILVSIAIVIIAFQK